MTAVTPGLVAVDVRQVRRHEAALLGLMLACRPTQSAESSVARDEVVAGMGTFVEAFAQTTVNSASLGPVAAFSRAARRVVLRLGRAPETDGRMNWLGEMLHQANLAAPMPLLMPERALVYVAPFMGLSVGGSEWTRWYAGLWRRALPAGMSTDLELLGSQRKDWSLDQQVVHLCDRYERAKTRADAARSAALRSPPTVRRAPAAPVRTVGLGA